MNLIRTFVVHRNAANLLMALMIILGLATIGRVNTQFFPSIDMPGVQVLVVWPGASAEDIESNIIEAIEPEVRFLDNVKDVFAFSRESTADVQIMFDFGTDMTKARADVEAAIARITTLPAEAEEPLISTPDFFDTMMHIVLSGPFPEAALRTYAKEIRDALIADGVDKVSFTGMRSEQLKVEVEQAALMELGLTVNDISRAIAAAGRDTPSGVVEGATERQVRAIGEADTAEKLGVVEVRALESGVKVRLRDFARIDDTYDSDEPVARRNGEPAIDISISRSSSADALKTSAAAQETITRVLKTLPPTLKVQIYDVQANAIAERISLLVNNGAGGLVLVVAILYLFLSGRLAFWVAAGIPVAMLFTISLMFLFDQSFNMMSLFAMIMTLGIIVDDAIVVGEHASTLREKGMGAIEAAEQGAKRMLGPVMAASLTTVAAFIPILLMGDEFGQVMGAITYVVVAVVIASLIECFLVLPGHLRSALRPEPKPASGSFRDGFNKRFDGFRDGPFKRFVTKCYDWRYTTFATAVAILIVCTAMLGSGRLEFTFFPQPESERINISVFLTPGAPRQDIEIMLDEIDRALAQIETDLAEGPGSLSIIGVGTVARLNSSFFFGFNASNVGSYTIELTPSDVRDVRTHTIIDALKKEISPIAGVERVVIRGLDPGPPGEDIDVRLYGGDTATLKAAGLEVQELLSAMPGVSDVSDDLPYGKPELLLELTPRGTALGFTSESIGRQVRNAFQGAVARRFARGDEEVEVVVQYPDRDTTPAALRNLYVTSPMGEKVPLSQIVTIREQQGFARIRRENGRREIGVSAALDESIISVVALMQSLEEAGLEKITDKYGLKYHFSGRFEDQQKATGDLGTGFQVGMASIYIILAWVFASYARPIVVMLIIPFGLIGAIVGHVVMGVPLNMLSLVALLGLAGILVNDSIILVTTIDEKIRGGMDLREAVIQGAQDRLRAVLLTSLTTVGGLLPLLFERSLQAQFVIPMGITIAFGLGTATFLVLLLVPAVLGIQEDLRRLIGRKPSPPTVSDHRYEAAE
ncbi:MAG: efflux RND transporter permease subunit [Alphaproteobacteria bacterium]